jgi:hemoglobin-like flavoprotein
MRHRLSLSETTASAASSTSCAPERSATETEPMDETQKELVRATFAKVAPIADQAGMMLYQNIFAMDPSLRRLFKTDIQSQARKVIGVLATAIAHLDRLDEVMPTVRELGRKHVAYGVSEKDYDTVGAALLKTLEAALGEAFTPAVRGAWAACYAAITNEMKAAAASACESDAQLAPAA